jgi:recombination protein RecA
MYNKGISYEGDLVDLGVRFGIVDKKGAWFQYEGEKLGQGREAAKQLLRENKKIANKILKEVNKKAKEEDIF